MFPKRGLQLVTLSHHLGQTELLGLKTAFNYFVLSIDTFNFIFS